MFTVRSCNSARSVPREVQPLDAERPQLPQIVCSSDGPVAVAVLHWFTDLELPEILNESTIRDTTYPNACRGLEQGRALPG
jgi:hypothetical protein